MHHRRSIVLVDRENLSTHTRDSNRNGTPSKPNQLADKCRLHFILTFSPAIATLSVICGLLAIYTSYPTRLGTHCPGLAPDRCNGSRFSFVRLLMLQISVR